ncbi:MAG: DUF4326 domain-containing protein [Rivularia sp. (in: cyanobacteria)]
MAVRVINSADKHKHEDCIQMRIDRCKQSNLGNPFYMSAKESDEERKAVIRAFRMYLWQSIQLVEKGEGYKKAEVDVIAKKCGVRFYHAVAKSSNSVVNAVKEIMFEDNFNKEDIALVCWCKPQACHGDVIISCIEWMNTK